MPRIPYKSIYDSIFIAKDEVPLAILLKQLQAMLRLHNYSEEDIAHFIDLEKRSAAMYPQDYQGTNSNNSNSNHSSNISSSNSSNNSSAVGKSSSTSRLAVSRSAHATTNTAASYSYHSDDVSTTSSQPSRPQPQPSRRDLDLDISIKSNAEGQVQNSARRSNTPRRGETNAAFKQQQEKEQKRLFR